MKKYGVVGKYYDFKEKTTEITLASNYRVVYPIYIGGTPVKKPNNQVLKEALFKKLEKKPANG